MAKQISQFVCQECGKVSPKSMGKCPQCGNWGSMVEEIVQSTTSKKGKAVIRSLSNAEPHRLHEISGETEKRIPLSIEEFSRVLGGGIVPGSIVLISGDPGIGKSTLLLQMAMEMTSGGTVLYISGEESEHQIKMRAMRVLQSGTSHEISENFYLLTETNLDAVLEHARQLNPAVIIIDSIQTMTLSELDSSAGTITQVREGATRLREFAKRSGVAVFLIGHVTKDGNIAGPRVLEHIVDTVLVLEGERYQAFRLLRSVKNRYGATSEVGVFEMRDVGMKEVRNPSEVFLAERMVNAAGSAIAVSMEGTRPILVEVQGLTSRSFLNNPRRTPNGVDFNRLLLVTAVLTRRMGMRLNEQDIFINVVGGMKINEPAADLPIAAAIASSYQDVPLRADTVLIGEIGLSGELRWVNQMPLRLREAAKLGFKQAIIPKPIHKPESWPKDIQIFEARSVKEALKFAFSDSTTTNQ
ncbi:MAG: DNA repair protein RadA [Anaerolineaceae bacterium]|nr:DNA repair protein RadA [Anaerolineaceae bacterium]